MNEIKAEIKAIPETEEKVKKGMIDLDEDLSGLNDTQKMQKFLEEHTKLQEKYKMTFDFQPQLRIVKMERMK